MRRALTAIFLARPHALALLLLAVVFLSLNLFSNLALRNARLDLTQNGLFTLSQGTRNIVAGLQEPIRLKFYYSQAIAAEQPGLRVEAQRVRDMLEEITMAADGMVELDIIDPEPFSEAEDQAVAQGLVARPVAEGEVVYFGLVGTNLVDNVEIIPYFAAERQQYLEYDLARLLHNLGRPQKPVLGIISNLPLDTGAGGIMAAMRGQSQPFLIYAELSRSFRCRVYRAARGENPQPRRCAALGSSAPALRCADLCGRPICDARRTRHRFHRPAIRGQSDGRAEWRTIERLYRAIGYAALDAPMGGRHGGRSYCCR
jgi:hypothetical protein